MTSRYDELNGILNASEAAGFPMATLIAASKETWGAKWTDTEDQIVSDAIDHSSPQAPISQPALRTADANKLTEYYDKWAQRHPIDVLQRVSDLSREQVEMIPDELYGILEEGPDEHIRPECPITSITIGDDSRRSSERVRVYLSWDDKHRLIWCSSSELVGTALESRYSSLFAASGINHAEAFRTRFTDRERLQSLKIDNRLRLAIRVIRRALF